MIKRASDTGELTGWRHPTGKTPTRVALVALGPSRQAFIDDQTRHHPAIGYDEVWTLNTGVRTIQHDMAFIMDDMDYYAEQFPEYGRTMEAATKPILTSVAYPRFGAAVAYPLQDVIRHVGYDNVYFDLSSVPYALAYASLIGVKLLSLYGCDYSFPGVQGKEEGRACVEYWMGWCSGRGMHVTVPQTTTLLGARRGIHFYGYLRQPVLRLLQTGEPLPVATPDVKDETSIRLAEGDQ